MSSLSNPLLTHGSSSSPASPVPATSIRHLKSSTTLRELRQHHARAIKTGDIRDPLTSAEVLRASALSSDRDLGYAHSVFDQMPDPNCFSWNTMIRAFAESEDRPSDALLFYHRMLLCDKSPPNKYTFPSVLKACSKIEAIDEGKQIHCHIVKAGFGEDEFVLTNSVRMYALCGQMEDALQLVRMGRMSLSASSEAAIILHNIMIDGYFRLGMVEDARKAFYEMPKRSLISWNEMISRYAQTGYFKEAVDVFGQMQSEGVKPNYVTLVSVLPAISRIGALELGKWLHIYAEKNGMLLDDVLGSALVDMYSKCGNIDKAIQVFDTLPKNNSITWSVLIGGLAMHGRARDAIGRFLVMEKAGVIPTDVVFIAILNACSHAGLVDEGRFFFDRMVKVYGFSPRIEHYGCMVDMLGRAGLLREAEEIIENMPIEPDDVIYKALLSACKIHGDGEIGARVANKIRELASQDAGFNVLLSNYYASIGDWGAVSEVRLKMKELDIRKDPGCSWITLNGTTHEFVVADDSHPRTKEIHSILEEISDKLSASGHV